MTLKLLASCTLRFRLDYRIPLYIYHRQSLIYMRLRTPHYLLAVAALVSATFLVAFAMKDDSGTLTANASAPAGPPHDPSQQWRDYWYGGKAELTSYKLEQARYGEMHRGEVVLIFVAENFSEKELTKADGLPGASVPVLKCNFDKKFNTGIYPYAMMMTAAMPVDVGSRPHAMKVSCSVSEWCGHVYTQLNLRGNKYDYDAHSYFPGEGDQKGTVAATLTEDELWSRIRIAPDKLPIGKHQVLPSVFFLRLRHRPLTLVEAMLTLTDNRDKTSTYTVQYLDGSRTLKVHFEQAFPYTILDWEEKYEEGFGPDAHAMTTRAVRNKSLQLDYWSRHEPGDTVLRQQLGLE